MTNGTRKIKLDGIEQSLPVEIITEDGVGLIKHDVLEMFISKQPRIKATYKAIYVNPPVAVIECHMEDTQSGYSVIKVGETSMSTLKGDISRNYGVTIAYQRAYNRAAIALLGLSDEGHIYSDVEGVTRADLEKRNTQASQPQQSVKPAQQVQPQPKPQQAQAPKAAQPVQSAEYIMTDDTLILIGGSKGQKYGDVKNTKKFQSFVLWCKNPKTVCSFNGEEETKQFNYIRNVL